jgi:hypothetical protein
MFNGLKYKQIWTNSILFSDIIPKMSFISFIFYFPISSNPFIHIEQMKNNLENAITKHSADSGQKKKIYEA